MEIETGLEINPINAPARARNSAAPACPRGAVSGGAPSCSPDLVCVRCSHVITTGRCSMEVGSSPKDWLHELQLALFTFKLLAVKESVQKE